MPPPLFKALAFMTLFSSASLADSVFSSLHSNCIRSPRLGASRSLGPFFFFFVEFRLWAFHCLVTRQKGVEAPASQLLVVSFGSFGSFSSGRALALLLICTLKGAVVPLEYRWGFTAHIHSNQSICIFFFLSNYWSLSIFGSSEISTKYPCNWLGLWISSDSIHLISDIHHTMSI